MEVYGLFAQNAKFRIWGSAKIYEITMLLPYLGDHPHFLSGFFPLAIQTNYMTVLFHRSPYLQPIFLDFA